jgi:hypothetical protein
LNAAPAPNGPSRPAPSHAASRERVARAATHPTDALHVRDRRASMPKVMGPAHASLHSTGNAQSSHPTCRAAAPAGPRVCSRRYVQTDCLGIFHDVCRTVSRELEYHFHSRARTSRQFANPSVTTGFRSSLLVRSMLCLCVPGGNTRGRRRKTRHRTRH